MLLMITIFVACFLGALLVWWMVSGFFRNADVDRMRSRILESPGKKKSSGAAKAPTLLSKDEQKTGQILVGMLKKWKLNHHLQELVEQAGVKWKPARVLQSCLFAFIAGFFLVKSFLPSNLEPLALAAAALFGAMPVISLVRMRRKRIARFEEMFPESLEFMARSMRAGHGFSVSLELIHREFQEPLAGEFRRTFDEHNLGMPLENALLKLSTRVPLLDVHFFVSAVLLQKRTGGNLAEILDKLAYVIRERFKLRGKIRAISAHGRMTGMALTCIPMGVAGLMFYVNPGYVNFFLDDSTGNIMLGAAVLLQMIGYAIIRKIVTIEV